MKKRSNFFDLLLFFIVIAEFFGSLLNKNLIYYIANLSFVPLLVIYFLYITRLKNNKFSLYIIFGLLLSWCAEWIKISDNGESIYFILNAMLWTIVCLLFSFAMYNKIKSKHRTSILSFDPLISLPIFIVIGIIYYVLFPFLELLNIPAIIILVSSGLLFTSALSRNNKTSQMSFRYMYRGSLFFTLFIISMLLYQFVNFQYGNLSSIIFYSLAQYLITRGAIEHLKN